MRNDSSLNGGLDVRTKGKNEVGVSFLNSSSSNLSDELGVLLLEKFGSLLLLLQLLDLELEFFVIGHQTLILRGCISELALEQRKLEV